MPNTNIKANSKNLYSFKHLFQSLLSDQSIRIDVILLKTILTPPSIQLNPLHDHTCQRYAEFLTRRAQVLRIDDYKKANSIFLNCIKLIFNYATQHDVVALRDAAGIKICDTTTELELASAAITNLNEAHISKNCMDKLTSISKDRDAVEIEELLLYSEYPWFRDLIIPVKHEIEKYNKKITADYLASKYYDMRAKNSYSVEFGCDLPKNINSTNKTICKYSKALSSILNPCKTNDSIIFPYMDYISALISDNRYKNTELTAKMLQDFYKEFDFYNKYSKLLHGNNINEYLSDRKIKYLLKFLKRN